MRGHPRGGARQPVPPGRASDTHAYAPSLPATCLPTGSTHHLAGSRFCPSWLRFAPRRKSHIRQYHTSKHTRIPFFVFFFLFAGRKTAKAEGGGQEVAPSLVRQPEIPGAARGHGEEPHLPCRPAYHIPPPPLRLLCSLICDCLSGRAGGRGNAGQGRLKCVRRGRVDRACLPHPTHRQVASAMPTPQNATRRGRCCACTAAFFLNFWNVHASVREGALKCAVSGQRQHPRSERIGKECGNRRSTSAATLALAAARWKLSMLQCARALLILCARAHWPCLSACTAGCRRVAQPGCRGFAGPRIHAYNLRTVIG